MTTSIKAKLVKSDYFKYEIIRMISLCKVVKQYLQNFYATLLEYTLLLQESIYKVLNV